MRFRRTGGSLLLSSGVLAVAVGCGAPSSPFNTANARAHIEHLAGAIGPRPLGSENNARARRYLVEQLQRYGFTVRIQDAEARNARRGVTGRVRNLIAFKAGRRLEAVGLVAHYDSVDRGPGAADDALGVAVALEAARVLAARERTWSLLVLLTDGEEDGLLGATAAATDEEILERLKTYVNLEATGPAAPVVLFESGPGSGWMLEAWARSAPRPNGSSYSEEIYRRLPNDTDFSIFKSAGVPGLNIAAVGDAYVYHTPLDRPERITDRVLTIMGANTVAWVEALEGEDITARTADPAVFFDLIDRWAGAWSATAWQMVDMALLVVALLGWLRLTFITTRRVHVRGMLLACTWAALTIVLVVATAVGGLWLLRAVREVYHPWYAHPWRTVLLVSLLLLSAAWILFRLAAHLPRVVRTERDPALIWVPTLAVWGALAAAVAWMAPLGAYLWTLPAGTAGLLVGTAAGWRLPMAIASWMTAGVASALWLPDSRDLVTFIVPTLGWLPIVTPIWLLPAVVLLPAMMIVPPIAAALAATQLDRPRFATRVLLTATVFVFAWAYLSDAYTTSRPERRLARYLADESTGQARWEIAGNEPGLGVAAGAPAGWRPVGAGETLAVEPPLPLPFVFVTEAAVEPSPVTAVRRTSVAPDGTVALEVDVTPDQDDVWVSLLLPSGREPLESTYPGRVHNGRWRAAYGTVPAEGVTFRLIVPPGSESWLDELRVAAYAAVPGATARGLGPAWLPEGRATWEARAMYVSPVQEAPEMPELAPLPSRPLR